VAIEVMVLFEFAAQSVSPPRQSEKILNLLVDLIANHNYIVDVPNK
jgi:hypothetical protein